MKMKLFLLLWSGLVFVRIAHTQESPLRYLEKQWNALKPWLTDTLAIRAEMNANPHRLDTLFDWNEIAHRALRDNWINLSKTSQALFISSVRQMLLRDISHYLLKNQKTIRTWNLRWKDEELSEHRAKVFLDRIIDPEIESIQLRLSRYQSIWKIADYRTDHFGLIRDYFRGLDSLLSEGYHPDYVLAVLMQAENLAIETFSSSSPEGFPLQWGWRKKDDRQIRRSSESFYITGPDSNRYLQIHLPDVMLVKPYSLNIRDFPVLRWRWRLRPVDATGRLTDYAPLASLTILFYQNWIGLPVTLSYIWHSGSTRCSNLKERYWFSNRFSVILRGRSDISDQWMEECIHLNNDFMRFYGYLPPPQIIGIYFQLHRSKSAAFCLEVDEVVAERSARYPFTCP